MTPRAAWRLGLAALAAFAGEAAACSCADTDSAPRLQQARTVALVRVQRVEVNPEWQAQLATDWPRAHPLRADAEVLEVLRGAPPPTVRLLGGRGEGGCGLPLQPGDDVLLVDAGAGDEFELHFCSDSRVLGMVSLLESAGRPVRASFERLYLHAVRDYLLHGTPIHDCLVNRVPPPPAPPDAAPDAHRVDCWTWLREQSEEAPR